MLSTTQFEIVRYCYLTPFQKQWQYFGPFSEEWCTTTLSSCKACRQIQPSILLQSQCPRSEFELWMNPMSVLGPHPEPDETDCVTSNRICDKVTGLPHRSWMLSLTLHVIAAWVDVFLGTYTPWKSLQSQKYSLKLDCRVFSIQKSNVPEYVTMHLFYRQWSLVSRLPHSIEISSRIWAGYRENFMTKLDPELKEWRALSNLDHQDCETKSHSCKSFMSWTDGKNKH